MNEHRKPTHSSGFCTSGASYLHNTDGLILESTKAHAQKRSLTSFFDNKQSEKTRTLCIQMFLTSCATNLLETYMPKALLAAWRRWSSSGEATAELGAVPPAGGDCGGATCITYDWITVVQYAVLYSALLSASHTVLLQAGRRTCSRKRLLFSLLALLFSSTCDIARLIVSMGH